MRYQIIFSTFEALLHFLKEKKERVFFILNHLAFNLFQIVHNIKVIHICNIYLPDIKLNHTREEKSIGIVAQLDSRFERK